MKKMLVNNKKYWNSYYSKSDKNKFSRPSKFGIFFFKKFLKKDNYLLELGCGNGRDTFCFYRKTKNIVSIDESLQAINKNILLARKTNKNIKFLNCKFENFTIKKKINIVYARFFLHAINLNQENKLISFFIKIKKYCKVKVALEFRTNKDKLLEKGKIVGKNERFTNHYRRFIDVNKFLKKIKKNGCKIIYMKQGTNFSKTKDENPHLCRIVFELWKKIQHIFLHIFPWMLLNFFITKRDPLKQSIHKNFSDPYLPKGPNNSDKLFFRQNYYFKLDKVK